MTDPLASGNGWVSKLYELLSPDNKYPFFANGKPLFVPKFLAG
jgi:hypothetical protein